jgi:hypothetical protein
MPLISVATGFYAILGIQRASTVPFAVRLSRLENGKNVEAEMLRGCFDCSSQQQQQQQLRHSSLVMIPRTSRYLK